MQTLHLLSRQNNSETRSFDTFSSADLGLGNRLFCAPINCQSLIVSLPQQAKIEGVDLENPPPDDKLFEHQELENEDQQLLRSQAAQKSAKDSNITINLTLPEGLAAAPAPLQQQQQPHLVPHIPAQISLRLFCTRFNLTDDIYNKLNNYSVTGPQTLRHLKNAHLMQALLNPAQVADVRDAQDRWTAGEGEGR